MSMGYVLLGDAYIAWKNEMKIYEPTDFDTKYNQLVQEFNNIKLNLLGDNPATYVQKLEYQNQRIRKLKASYAKD